MAGLLQKIFIHGLRGIKCQKFGVLDIFSDPIIRVPLENSLCLVAGLSKNQVGRLAKKILPKEIGHDFSGISWSYMFLQQFVKVLTNLFKDLIMVYTWEQKRKLTSRENFYKTKRKNNYYLFLYISFLKNLLITQRNIK